jgi:hypothetical protein
MKDRFQVVPKRVARGRKIQVRQFEPEEIWVEYELTIQDPKANQEALEEANRLAMAFLDAQEMELRQINENNIVPTRNNSQRNQKINNTVYELKLTDQGKKTQLHIVPSNNLQFQNFIHLWHGKNNDTYVGHLKKDTGEFKFKPENKAKIVRMGIKQGTHFRVIKALT